MKAEPLIDAFVQPANHPYFVKEKTLWTIDRAASVSNKCRAANSIHSAYETAAPTRSPATREGQQGCTSALTGSNLAGKAQPLPHSLHRLPWQPTAGCSGYGPASSSQTRESSGSSDDAAAGHRLAATGAISSKSSLSSPVPRRSSYLSGSRSPLAASTAGGGCEPEAAAGGGGSGSLAFLTESIKRKKEQQQQQQQNLRWQQQPSTSSADERSQEQTEPKPLPPSLQRPLAGGFLNAAYEASGHGKHFAGSDPDLPGDNVVARNVELAAEASEGDSNWDACCGFEGGIVFEDGSRGVFAGWRAPSSSAGASDALSASGSSCHEDDIRPVALILHVADDHRRGNRDDGGPGGAVTGGGQPSRTRRWFSRQKHDGGSALGHGCGFGASESGSLRYHRNPGRGHLAPPFERSAAGSSAGHSPDSTGERRDMGSSGCGGMAEAASTCKQTLLSPSPCLGHLRRSRTARSRSRSRSPSSDVSCSSSRLLPEHAAAAPGERHRPPPPRSPSYGSVDSLAHSLPPIGAAATSAGRLLLRRQLLKQHEESSFFDIVVAEPATVGVTQAALRPPGCRGPAPPLPHHSAVASETRPSVVLQHLEQFDMDDEDDDGGGGSGGTRRERKWQRQHRRRRLLVAAALFLVAAAAASGAVAAYMLTAGKGSPAELVGSGVSKSGHGYESSGPFEVTTQEPSSQLLPVPSKQTRFVGSVLLKIEYTPEMANLQSIAARNLSGLFCDTVKRIYGERNLTSNMVYDDCTVTQLLPGSVKVSFKITFKESAAPNTSRYNDSAHVEEVRKALESEVSTSKFGTLPCDDKALTVDQVVPDEAAPLSPSLLPVAEATSAGNGSMGLDWSATATAAILSADRSNQLASKSRHGIEGSAVAAMAASSTSSELEKLNATSALMAAMRTQMAATVEPSSLHNGSTGSTGISSSSSSSSSSNDNADPISTSSPRTLYATVATSVAAKDRHHVAQAAADVDVARTASPAVEEVDEKRAQPVPQGVKGYSTAAVSTAEASTYLYLSSVDDSKQQQHMWSGNSDFSANVTEPDEWAADKRADISSTMPEEGHGAEGRATALPGAGSRHGASTVASDTAVLTAPLAAASKELRPTSADGSPPPPSPSASPVSSVFTVSASPVSPELGQRWGDVSAASALDPGDGAGSAAPSTTGSRASMKAIVTLDVASLPPPPSLQFTNQGEHDGFPLLGLPATAAGLASIAAAAASAQPAAIVGGHGSSSSTAAPRSMMLTVTSTSSSGSNACMVRGLSAHGTATACLSATAGPTGMPPSAGHGMPVSAASAASDRSIAAPGSPNATLAAAVAAVSAASSATSVPVDLAISAGLASATMAASVATAIATTEPAVRHSSETRQSGIDAEITDAITEGLPALLSPTGPRSTSVAASVVGIGGSTLITAVVSATGTVAGMYNGSNDFSSGSSRSNSSIDPPLVSPAAQSPSLLTGLHTQPYATAAAAGISADANVTSDLSVTAAQLTSCNNGSNEPARHSPTVVATDPLSASADVGLSSPAAATTTVAAAVTWAAQQPSLPPSLPATSARAAAASSRSMPTLAAAVLSPEPSPEPSHALLETPMTVQSQPATQIGSAVSAAFEAAAAAASTAARLLEMADTQTPPIARSSAPPSSSRAPTLTAAVSARQIADTTVPAAGNTSPTAGARPSAVASTAVPAPDRFTAVTDVNPASRPPPSGQQWQQQPSSAMLALSAAALRTTMTSSTIPSSSLAPSDADRLGGGGALSSSTAAALPVAAASAALTTSAATPLPTTRSPSLDVVGSIVSAATSAGGTSSADSGRAAAVPPCGPGENSLRANATNCLAYYLCVNGEIVLNSCSQGEYFNGNTCVACDPSKCRLCAAGRRERAGDADFPASRPAALVEKAARGAGTEQPRSERAGHSSASSPGSFRGIGAASPSATTTAAARSFSGADAPNSQQQRAYSHRTTGRSGGAENGSASPAASPGPGGRAAAKLATASATSSVAPAATEVPDSGATKKSSSSSQAAVAAPSATAVAARDWEGAAAAEAGLGDEAVQNPCAGKPTGLAADPTDCRKYVFCTSYGQSIVHECGSHEMYSVAHDNACVSCDVAVCSLCRQSLGGQV